MKNKELHPLKKQKNTNQKEISKRKRILFNFIALLLPILLLLLLELCLRLFNYGYDLSLFKKSALYPGYNEINVEVGRRYFSKFEATISSNDIFLINKPDTCYRVFVMGCSTTLGFPYQTGTMFSRILNYRVQDAFPHKRIEFVNVAMTAINSYALADMIDEILKCKPDAILIYTGHNEYYGALGVGSVENGGNYRWLKRLHLKLIRFRTYQLIQNMISKTAKIFEPDKIDKGTLMERIAKDKAIEFGSPVYDAGIEQFRSNITEIVKKAKKSGIQIILSEIVSNIKDQKPFKSIKSINKLSADDFFEKARQFELKGDYSQARENYYLAKDYDVIRYRGPEALNVIIHEIGKKFDIPVVPMESVFENHSPHGFIGNNLMLEHLHPNLEGYFLMADAYFNEMKKEKLISSNWDSTLIKPSSFYRENWGFTPFDSLSGDIRIKMIKNGWPFKQAGVENDFLDTYVPVSYEDSVAFYSVKNKTHIEDEHINLANHYAQLGNNMAAFKEYYSLIKCYPYLGFLYVEAINYLMAAKKYNQVIDLLRAMPGNDTNFYATFQMAKVYAKLNNPEKAMYYYKKARKVIKPNDKLELLLTDFFNFCRATGNIDEERNAFLEIRTINPDFSPFSREAEFNEIDNDEVKKLINQSQIFLNQKNYEKAIELLQMSLKIKETGLANQIIGSIYFFKKDIKALAYYEKAYSADPLNPNVLNNLFLLYMMKNDLIKATNCLNEYRMVSNDKEKLDRLTGYLQNSMNKVMSRKSN
jgi:tetratricopeptide (TPR) repeat protein